MVGFRKNIKWPMLNRYLKKDSSNVLKSIALHPCYQFAVRYLKELYIIKHRIILLITIEFHKMSQVLNVETLALTN